ncbi:hypothetical protein RND71_001617 [Anisodus tanguticus]|uniref:Uncharacterized protein n=1 Tax=Anisodus tanguticus TaxID=243964 RepID=A0AAE1T0K9_9SOLA|nr:hypothetical protein RND71_001617 [Anisodus tanguticus]
MFECLMDTLTLPLKPVGGSGNVQGDRECEEENRAALSGNKRFPFELNSIVGLELEVVRILSLYTTMDLLSNKFEGHIPSMMGDLIALRVVNLSHNGLQGHISISLGKLSIVESLDLSFNQLSGEIPETLASLISLAIPNLSRNH